VGSRAVLDEQRSADVRLGVGPTPHNKAISRLEQADVQAEVVTSLRTSFRWGRYFGPLSDDQTGVCPLVF
jgi:hypothetical protein